MDAKLRVSFTPRYWHSWRLHPCITTAVLVLLTCGCSGPKSTENDPPGENGCSEYCDYIIACTPGWAQATGEEDCSWKYGEEEAHEMCVFLCHPDRNGYEDVSDAEMKECLECVVEKAGDACPTPFEVSSLCPVCTFDSSDYATEATPAIEPLICASGDVFHFSGNAEDGQFRRDQCLEQDKEAYCN